MESAAITIVSFATNSEELFKATIEFYEKLNFVVNTQLGPSEESASFRRALEATHEVRLVLGSHLSGKESAVNLHLTTRGIDAKEQAQKSKELNSEFESLDWRSVANASYFLVDDLSLFPLDKFTHQQMPKIGDPDEVYVVDPLGNLICFTSHLNAVSDIPIQARPKLETAPNQGDILPTDSDTVPADSFSGIGVRKRIAVLTSGGDAPGMNACVRAVVRTAIYNQCEAYAIYEGYEGLIRGGNYIRKLEWDDVRGYLGIGGTFIGSARCMGFKEREGRLTACHNMVQHGIDGLVVCGGDGSLTGADLFRAEWPDLIKQLLDDDKISKEEYEKYKYLKIAGTVGSIDNDMAHTDVTIGAYSSLERICTNVDWISATAESHARAFVIEVMGRHCGWLALMAAIATRADYCFIPELPPKAGEWADQMCEIAQRHRERGRRRTIVIVAEGAIDSELNPIKSSDVKDQLSRIGLDTRVTTLGHVQRGGSAVAIDRLLGTLQGAAAVDAILKATPDTPSPMIGIKENKIIITDLVEAVRDTKKVASAIEAKDFDEARSLRNTEFQTHLENYITLSKSDRKSRTHAAKTPLNVAIIAVGAPAGGMNAAISAAASYCFSRGHTPYAIGNSWSGLARHESVRELTWLQAEGMFTEGGCEIGTNRSLPDCDIGMIAYYFGKYRFDGLIIVGGFEAFKSLHMLDRYRELYPAFRIPMVCLPATISNNVPGSEYSLGTDTCLNVLTDYCDVVKQSAASTRRRVFVVEVQGGRSGFIASYVALVCGAHAVYTPETGGFSLSQLSADIKHLRECFAADEGRQRAGRLVIRNEKAAPGFTTENLAAVFEAESNTRYDAREAIPGHLQQGGQPSANDRVRATRFAITGVHFIEENQKVNYREPSEREEAAVVIGVEGSKLRFTSVNHLWEYETESKERRPKRIHWQTLLDMANVMTRRPMVKLKAASVVNTPQSA